ncbi:SDR family NAD(P)-dependent oxidoreductase [Frondihabitans cladoniiphilus]|uniref:SDR family oxidoreductase n=1 Tax=Frondihabitans cladoniiphilus TaxID=715785 RepID=A0ABP8W842_9MICO
MTESFAGKVVIVTGATSGLGFATAKAFAEAGASVALADLRTDELIAAANRLSATGLTVTAIACDVADDAQVAALVAGTVERYGAVDIAFNNAGIQPDGQNTADVSAETFDKVMAVNLRGVWSSIKHEVIQMQKQGGGVIINNSSIGGVVGAVGQAAYHASKHGVLGLTKSVALEYATEGIRVVAIAPGTIDTPLVANIRDNDPDTYDRIMKGTPMERVGSVDEISSAVLWLASSGAAYVTGTTLVIDGGITAQ